MNYVKINNLFPPQGGTCDYKGLNIDLFVPGSQMYDGKVAYIATEEAEIPQHQDLQVLTKEEYDSFINEIKNRPRPLTESERLALLEKSMEELILSGGVL